MFSERNTSTRTTDSTEHESSWIQNELAEAHKTIRTLLRQIDKAQQRYDEISRAYKLTVDNLVEVSVRNNELEREIEQWKARSSGASISMTLGAGTLTLTPAEISAIRRAMARLHHPDTGGDTNRMQIWNAALDALEH